MTHPRDTPSTPATPSTASTPSRRTVLTSAGLAGVGAVTLAGCGTANSAVDKASSAASNAVKDAISKATIPVGGGKVFDAQKVVVTQPTSGDFKAFSAVCTHQSCLVAEVSGGTINCPCHGSQFDITTGAVKQGPATKPLPEKSVTVSGDGITIT